MLIVNKLFLKGFKTIFIENIKNIKKNKLILNFLLNFFYKYFMN